MINDSLINASLAEVWEWREQLRLACEGMSIEEELAYLRREAEKALRNHGLKPVPIGGGQCKLERLNSTC